MTDMLLDTAHGFDSVVDSKIRFQNRFKKSTSIEE